MFKKITTIPYKFQKIRHIIDFFELIWYSYFKEESYGKRDYKRFNKMERIEK